VLILADDNSNFIFSFVIGKIKLLGIEKCIVRDVGRRRRRKSLERVREDE
jgi:hypothetical protein